MLPSGEPVEAWTLTGASGLIVEAITFGGIVTKLLYPQGDGDWLDLVLGFEDLQPYVEGHPYFGTARLWDDGILDPADTRRVLGRLIGLAKTSAGPARFPVFRM